MDDSTLLGIAADLARQAGARILAVRAGGFVTERKADRSPVTEADHAAEAIIVEGLRRATPDIPVVAEEEMAAGHVPRDASAVWLVDPLDGTREFAAGSDDFAVNIGLVRDGRAVLGVVGVPAQGELFGGVVGRGAWKRTIAGERPITVRRAPDEGLAVIASRASAADPRMAEYLAGRQVASVEYVGAAVKFCWLAEGRADLYVRYGRTMEWDTAGPQAVLEAAGGAMRDLQTGAAFRYGKPGWENGAFVCTGAM